MDFCPLAGLDGFDANTFVDFGTRRSRRMACAQSTTNMPPSVQLPANSMLPSSMWCRQSWLMGFMRRSAHHLDSLWLPRSLLDNRLRLQERGSCGRSPPRVLSYTSAR